MSYQPPVGELEKFIGMFYKTNAKHPESRPEPYGPVALERIVVSKGKLLILTAERSVNIDIPLEEQTDQATYEGLLPLLTESLVKVLQVPQYTRPIQDAMAGAGIVAYFVGPTLKINPLTAGHGELDHSM